MFLEEKEVLQDFAHINVPGLIGNERGNIQPLQGEKESVDTAKRRLLGQHSMTTRMCFAGGHAPINSTHTKWMAWATLIGEVGLGNYHTHGLSIIS